VSAPLWLTVPGLLFLVAAGLVGSVEAAVYLLALCTVWALEQRS
jgi:hypothetical protein